MFYAIIPLPSNMRACRFWRKFWHCCMSRILCGMDITARHPYALYIIAFTAPFAHAFCGRRRRSNNQADITIKIQHLGNGLWTIDDTHNRRAHCVQNGQAYFGIHFGVLIRIHTAKWDYVWPHVRHVRRKTDQCGGGCDCCFSPVSLLIKFRQFRPI